MRMVKDWLDALPSGPVLTPLPRVTGLREGVAITEAFRGDVLVWLRLDAGAQAGSQVAAAMYEMHHGSSGRCSKRRSRATSWRIFRSATNRSTAPTRDMTRKPCVRCC
jgi:hypothetical protein